MTPRSSEARASTLQRGGARARGAVEHSFLNYRFLLDFRTRLSRFISLLGVPLFIQRDTGRDTVKRLSKRGDWIQS